MVSAAETKIGRFIYFDSDRIGGTIRMGAFWEEHLRPWFDKVNGGTVIDVGANIGFFTVYCARFRKANVKAFEASPEVFALLEQNVSMNACAAECFNVPLFDSETELALAPMHDGWQYYPTPDGRIDYRLTDNSGCLCMAPSTDKSRPYHTMSRTLDSYEFPDVRLIKIDVQGADLRVLVGARKTIEKYRPIVLFEYEPVPSALFGDALQDYLDYFKPLNYTLTLARGGGGTTDYAADPN